MQTVRKMRKRSGFTLVELLIVIIIIGILAGAMLLVAGSGTDSAEATKVISDLRSMKSAALLYYADHTSNPAVDTTNKVNLLNEYSDRTFDINDYSFFAPTDGNWFVGRRVPSTGAASKLDSQKEMLLGHTASVFTSADQFDPASDTWAFMKAR